ncbi:hypothetical protein [Herbihabitans rhizosphaerae]|nr:hypothetical protein [Herbihabitans rhizosphaerae]
MAIGCVLAFAVCAGLAVWQWNRFESASGTWQNLGYVLQWPLFGLFPAFMVWRMRKLRAQQAEQDAAPKPQAKPEPVAPVVPRQAPAEPDDELAEYNRYLKSLNDQETR